MEIDNVLRSCGAQLSQTAELIADVFPYLAEECWQLERKIQRIRFSRMVGPAYKKVLDSLEPQE